MRFGLPKMGPKRRNVCEFTNCKDEVTDSSDFDQQRRLIMIDLLKKSLKALRSLSLRSKTNASLAIAFIFLAVIGFISVRNTHILVDNSNWVVHSHEVKVTIDEVVSGMKDLETAQRIFLITGDEKHLEPYNTTLRSIDNKLDHLQQLTLDNEAQQKRIISFRNLKAQKLEELAKATQLRREKGLRAVTVLVQSNLERHTFEKLWRVAFDMTAEEDRLLQIRNAQVADSTQFTLLVIYAGVSLALLGLLGSVYIINLEITARRKAEAESRFIATIVGNAADAIISKDFNGIILSWNPAAEKIFGYSPKEAIGKSISMLIPLDRQEEEDRIVEKLKRGDHIDNYETKRLCKDGSLIDVAVTLSPIKDSAAKTIVFKKLREISRTPKSSAPSEGW